MKQAFQITPGRIYRGAKPRRDAAYRRWLRRGFPCAACGATSRIEACHSGPHGLSQKSDDYSCLPFCRKCHERFDSDPRGFAVAHDLDIPKLIAELNRMWESKTRSQS